MMRHRLYKIFLLGIFLLCCFGLYGQQNGHMTKLSSSRSGVNTQTVLDSIEAKKQIVYDLNSLEDQLLGIIRDTTSSDSFPVYYDARVSDVIPIRRELYLEDFGAVPDGETDILNAWNNMRDAVGYIQFSPGQSYFVDSTTILAWGNDSIQIIGNSATIIAAARSESYPVLQMGSNAKNAIIKDLAIVSTNEFPVDGYAGPGAATILTSNRQGIRSDTSTHLVIQNVTTRNLGYGLNIKTTDIVEVDGYKSDSCVMGIFVNESEHVSVTRAEINRSYFPDSMSLHHCIYLSESQLAEVSHSRLKGGGKSGLRAGNESTMFANPMTLKITNVTFDSLTFATALNYIDYVEAIGNTFLVGNAQTDICYSLNNINHIRTTGDRFINESSTAKQTYITNNTSDHKPLITTINNLETIGPVDLDFGSFKDVHLNNCVFDDALTAAGGNSDYIIGIPDGSDSTSIKLDNCKFIQRIVPVVTRAIRPDTGFIHVVNSEFINLTGSSYAHWISPLTSTTQTLLAENCRIYNSTRLINASVPLNRFRVDNIRDGVTGGYALDSYRNVASGNASSKGERFLRLVGGNTATLSTIDASRTGNIITIESADGVAVSVVGEAAQTINGAASASTTNSMSFISDGTNWKVLASGSKGLWSEVNSTDIHYTNGDVIIGANANPAQKLEVRGNIRISDSSAPILEFESGGGLIWQFKSGSSMFYRMLTTNGNFTWKNVANSDIIRLDMNGNYMTVVTGRFSVGINGAPTIGKFGAYGVGDICYGESSTTTASNYLFNSATGNTITDGLKETIVNLNATIANQEAGTLSFSTNGVTGLSIGTTGLLTAGEYDSGYTPAESPTSIAWFDETTGQFKKSTIQSLADTINDLKSYVELYNDKVSSIVQTVVANTPEQLHTLTLGLVNGFSESDDTITYDGTTTKIFHLTCSFAWSNDTAPSVNLIYIYLNDIEVTKFYAEQAFTVANDFHEGATCGLLELDPGDQITVYIESDTSSDIEIKHMNISLTEL